MFHRTLKVDDDFFYQEDAKGWRAAHREGRERRRFRFSRKRWILAALIILSLAVAGWIYTHRVKPVDMASYAPETALGYLEINNWPKLVDNLTSTKAWRELAPAYGVPEGLDYFGKIGSLSLGSLGSWALWALWGLWGI